MDDAAWAAVRGRRWGRCGSMPLQSEWLRLARPYLTASTNFQLQLAWSLWHPRHQAVCADGRRPAWIRDLAQAVG